MVGLKRARETVDAAAGKVMAAAADTRQAVIVIAVLAAAALGLALCALFIAAGARRAARGHAC